MKINSIITILFKTAFATALLLLLTLQSCIQREDNFLLKEYKVKGRLVQSCDNHTPIANKLIILESENNPILFCNNRYKVVSRTYTNSDGYFDLKYDRQECIYNPKVSIEDPNGHPTNNYPLVTYLKGNENTNLGNVYLHPTAIYNYVIKTNTPYTTTDTLFYNIKYLSSKDSVYSVAIGPFTNGQELTTHSHSAQRQVHHGDEAFKDKVYDMKNIWSLKATNGLKSKKHSDSIIFYNCVPYTITVDIRQ